MGVLVPVVPPYWLGEKPVVELELGTLRHIGPEQDGVGTTQFPTREAGRRRHKFVVYSGGRQTPSGERTG